MKKQIELRAAMVRAQLGYKGLARACRARGLEIDAVELSAVANGRRVPTDQIKNTVAAVLGKPTFQVFV